MNNKVNNDKNKNNGSSNNGASIRLWNSPNQTQDDNGNWVDKYDIRSLTKNMSKSEARKKVAELQAKPDYWRDNKVCIVGSKKTLKNMPKILSKELLSIIQNRVIAHNENPATEDNNKETVFVFNNDENIKHYVKTTKYGTDKLVWVTPKTQGLKKGDPDKRYMTAYEAVWRDRLNIDIADLFA